MERLAKFGIYLGMGIGITVFVMFLLIALPHMIEDTGRQWERIFVVKLSPEELKSLLHEHESYKLFFDKYPEAGEYYRYQGNGEARTEVIAMNFETQNTLQLELNYNKHDQSIYEEVSCFNRGQDIHYQVRGSLTREFIEEVACLDGDGIIASPSPLIDEDGNPVPYHCEEGFFYESGSRICTKY